MLVSPCGRCDRGAPDWGPRDRECDVAQWLGPAILLAVHTGLRQGELLRLRWHDIDGGLQLATIAQTKNNTKKHAAERFDAAVADVHAPSTVCVFASRCGSFRVVLGCG